MNETNTKYVCRGKINGNSCGEDLTEEVISKALENDTSTFYKFYNFLDYLQKAPSRRGVVVFCPSYGNGNPILDIFCRRFFPEEIYDA